MTTRKRKRGNGDGSIYKLNDRKRKKPWVARVTVGWNNEGKQIIKYLGTYETQKEAKTALMEYLVSPYDLNKITFENVYNSWIEKADLKEGTIANHKTAFNKLKPLHNKEISVITLKDLETLVLAQKPTMQASIKRTLGNMYKYALRYDYVKKDLSKLLQLDKHTNIKEINTFTSAEIKELWNNVGSKNYDEMPLLLLYTGLRISELLNVRIKDIDIEKRALKIPDSKTINGVRTIPIHEKIVPLIEKRYDIKQKYLFHTINNKKIDYRNFIKHHWYLNHTRHEARHTFISALTKCVEDRVSIKLIVGHSKTDITDHYTHRTHEELLEAINKIEY